MIADVVLIAAVTAVFFVALRRQLKRVEAAAPPRTLTITLTADTSQFRAAMAEASRGMLILPDGEAHDVTVTPAPWQRSLVERVADAYTRGEPVEYFQAMFARRTSRAQFRAALDLEMHRRGWTVVSPGVYQPPDSAHHDPTGQATFIVADETRLWPDERGA